MIKHFTFTNAEGQQGRFAVAFDGDRVHYAHLAGIAPNPQHLLAGLRQFPELIAAANEASRRRINPYAVERRRGMSGALDYRLVECRNRALADYPTRARLHVSMSGKLNVPFSMWLGDFPALVWEVSKDFPFDAEAYPVEEAPHKEYKDWTTDAVQLGIMPFGLSASWTDSEYVAAEVLRQLEE